MATVTGFTAERMLEIEQTTVTSGLVDASGNLLLYTREGTELEAGSVMPGLETLLPAIRNFLYPVGCIYMSVVSTNPGTIFGGTWALWGSGRVPVGVDSDQAEFDTVEEIGGAKTVLLTANQSGLRTHTHLQNAHTHTQNSHTHSALDGNAANYLSQAGTTYGVQYSASTTGATTAVNQATTAVNQAVAAANATEAHTNLQPYITCYMWKRTA